MKCFIFLPNSVFFGFLFLLVQNTPVCVFVSYLYHMIRDNLSHEQREQLHTSDDFVPNRPITNLNVILYNSSVS